jgi:quercetin dioxygenase-like cupin family protein
MAKQGKIWGNTESLFNRNNVSIHRIEGQKGGYCSKHRHEAKWNKFYVEAGELKIEQWSGDMVDVTVLKAGESCEVAPGVYHRFSVLRDCVAYEIYWVSLDAEDITRVDQGGVHID